jgi:EAL domain-containing protein (putative c-di-GMP-specific phosphodiesterase class I)
MQWCLKAVADAEREWLVSIDSVPFIIGRADNCNLKLIDKRISRNHTEIRISGDLLWVRDLKSTNGTFVNHEKIDQAEMLEPDDTISIGGYKFQVLKVIDATSTIVDETIATPHSTDRKELYSIESKFRMLLEQRNVTPYFQPIVRFCDTTIVGYEILGRVPDNELPSNPAELFDMAEWFGCGSNLSSLFREVGVEIATNLPGSPLLFVNTSQLELLEMEALLASLERIRDLAPSQKIVLEINEKAAAGADEILQLRQALKRLDIGLAFDDFGVGQTRLVELSNISPNYLKFDMSLIRQIHLAPKRLHHMISTFVTAAHDLGICTIAEGIECPEEARVCGQLGFDLAQGFFFGKPMPIYEIDENASYPQTLHHQNPASSSKTDQKDGLPANGLAAIIKSFSKTTGIL